ncbi:MAG: ElyC/SanA/YdcF family protein [Candidatus Obscuribacterales bacterium]|jgi:SanA protein
MESSEQLDQKQAPGAAELVEPDKSNLVGVELSEVVKSSSATADKAAADKSSPATSQKRRRWLEISGLVSALLIVGLFAIYNEVENQPYRIYSDAKLVPATSVAIVFGAGIGSREFKDRVSTAATLYKLGKVKKLLMTGDNGHLSYNEPQAMKDEAVRDGVPAADITCDYAGFRTYDSLYRAKEIFEVKQAVLVTQRYHLPRAMFLAQKLGLEVTGVDAGIQSYGSIQSWYDFREIIAAETAWLDVMTDHKPKFLGKKEPLFPNGEKGK